MLATLNSSMYLLLAASTSHAHVISGQKHKHKHMQRHAAAQQPHVPHPSRQTPITGSRYITLHTYLPALQYYAVANIAPRGRNHADAAPASASALLAYTTAGPARYGGSLAGHLLNSK